ncbi:MAG: hypothetical protein ACLUS4_03025 [Hominenteromicrobium sp.]
MKTAESKLANTFAVAHFVFPYLLVKIMLSTPPYSPEKTGAISKIITNERTIKIFAIFWLVLSQPFTYPTFISLSPNTSATLNPFQLPSISAKWENTEDCKAF